MKLFELTIGVYMTQTKQNSTDSASVLHLIKELKPILSFLATSSLYGISLALLLSFFLIGSLMLLSSLGS